MPSTASTLAEHLRENIKIKDKKQKELLEKTLKLSGGKMEANLLTTGLVTKEELAKLKAEYFHIPFVKVEDLEVDEKAFRLLPSSTLERYKIAPFQKQGKKVKIAIANPTNLQTLEALEFLAKKNDWDVQLYLVTDDDLKSLMQKSSTGASEVTQAIAEFSKVQNKRAKGAPGTGEKPESPEIDMEEKAPVTKLIDGLISQALSKRASDIHIEPLEKKSRVRFRVDGVLRKVFDFPLDVHNAVLSKIKILANLKIDEQRLPQDGRFKMEWEGKMVDFRVSTFPTTFGEKAVLRALYHTDDIPSFKDLGITGQRLGAIKKGMSKSHGMLLVTGPTGSGKSTTLFVVLSELNKPGVNIITLEDPVEYLLPGANQSQVNPKIGFTFASGLRSILRQDPNIILIGEIRDKETAELAVHSALTGHSVFSTLHTNDAVGALPRLIDMGVEPFLITASVNGILAQRLVRTICPDCKKEVKVSQEVKEMLSKELNSVPKSELSDVDIKNPKIYQGQGCKKCGDTGYKGRIGIFEAIEVTPEIAELTLSKASPDKMRDTARSQGMITIRQDGFIKVLDGVTTVEEVLRSTSE